MKYVVFSDGGARGNPGPAGFGFLIKSEKSQKPNLKSQTHSIHSINLVQASSGQANSNPKTITGSGYIGVATNNQAEYRGVIAALTKLYEIDNHPEDIQVNLDSKLIVEQMNGVYKIKSDNIKPLYWDLRDIVNQLGISVKFKHIPREKNKEADKLVNEEIDRGKY